MQYVYTSQAFTTIIVVYSDPSALLNELISPHYILCIPLRSDVPSRALSTVVHIFPGNERPRSLFVLYS